MKTILVIDDENDLLQSLEMLLGDEGYKVLLAQDGYAGLEIIKKNKVDLILLDIMMPKFSGIDFLWAIQGMPNYKKIPIILISASKPPAKEKGISWNGFLQKPFDIDELLAEIKRINI